MRVLNTVYSFLLAAFAAFTGLLFIGSKEEHDHLLLEDFWGTLGLRFSVAVGVGLMGAVGWWLLNLLLLKSGMVRSIALDKLAFTLSAAVTIGAVAGALVFCL